MFFFFLKWWSWQKLHGFTKHLLVHSEQMQLSHKFNTPNKRTRDTKVCLLSLYKTERLISLTAEPPVAAAAETWSSVFLVTCSSLLLNFFPSSHHRDLCKQQLLHKCHRKRDLPYWTFIRGADIGEWNHLPSASDYIYSIDKKTSFKLVNLFDRYACENWEYRVW